MAVTYNLILALCSIWKETRMIGAGHRTIFMFQTSLILDFTSKAMCGASGVQHPPSDMLSVTKK